MIGVEEVSGVGCFDMVWVRRTSAPGVAYNHGGRFKWLDTLRVSALEYFRFPRIFPA